MQITITKEFDFDAAHHITKYYGKCERPHGHTYKLCVTIQGDLSPNDMVLDFIILKRVVKKHVLSKLDHYDLNDIIENPTTENVAIWIFNKLKNIATLLTEELNDPNLDQDIKNYLTTTDNIDKSQESFQLQLKEIKLYESGNAYVTITND